MISFDRPPTNFTVSFVPERTQLSMTFIIKTRTNDITLFSTQLRSQSSSAISDVTSSVQLVGRIWLARIGLGTRLLLTEWLSLKYRKRAKPRYHVGMVSRKRLVNTIHQPEKSVKSLNWYPLLRWRHSLIYANSTKLLLCFESSCIVFPGPW